MKKRILKSSNWLYGLIIGLLGFSIGCQTSGRHAEMYGPPPTPEYGCPVVTYVVSGKVTDENNHPIKDIQVDFTSQNELLGSVQTNDQGKYLFQQVIPKTDLINKIIYRDTDGIRNGGEFETTTKEVTFNNEDFTGGDGNWNQGEAKKEVNVILEKTE